MKLVDQQIRAREFAKRWANTGDEKSESQKFWLDLLENVLGVEDPYSNIEFESRIKLDNTSFIDGYIESTHVLIEQKSSNKDLSRPIVQSDGTKLSPFQQAKRYSIELPYSRRPRWIITCNFKEFFVYDMEKPNAEADIIELKDLDKEIYRLNFIVSQEEEFIKKETQISIEAGEIVASLYEALLREYQDPNNEVSLHSLNILCVRLVFCLYAEDAGLFGNKNMFHDYLHKYKDTNPRAALINLFRILNQKEEDRDPYEDKDLLAFPYVNGGLFADMDVEIPRLNTNIVDIILNRASLGFDWSKISPTIFGSVFESTLNPETRRSGGMHYTSIKNIHKVIDPLFLDDLKEEFSEIKEINQVRQKKQRLEELHNKIANLKFLDPAAGSGNFLTETYISLRKLENKIIEEKIRKKDVVAISFIDGTSDELQNPIRVNLDQFYGIEINDFAVTVARTALWISEDQMMKETMDIIHQDMNILPLKTYANIVEGNALTMDWNDLVDKNEVDYIMGNPPFVGKKEQSKTQKEDLIKIFGKIKGVRNIDYVAGWFKKAAKYIEGTNIRIAFVSTNSICQGEQASIIWKNLFNENKININFAYQTFKWMSEAKIKAHVHVVIIGFSLNENTKKYIFRTDDNVKIVDNINGYLVEGPNVFIENRSMPICDVAKISYGSMPIDNGTLILNQEEKDEILKENSNNIKFIREYIGGSELINNKVRWCIWLKDIEVSAYRKSKLIMNRIKENYEFRKSSKRVQTQQLADIPYLFGEIRQANSTMLVIPKVSSEKRKYLPMKFVNKEVIVNGSALIIPTDSLCYFGILNSNVHMSWMRAVAGRMKSDYQYSSSIVYNNFPWPKLDDYHKRRIEKSAQMILDARDLYPLSSLADLYDDLTMPKELRKSHQENDARVMKAYGFDFENMTESECVAELMKMYEKLVDQK